MAKSMRSKRKKRLRAIRRDIVATEPTVLKKEAAKLAAQEAALAAPKLIVKSPFSPTTMDTSGSTSNTDADTKMDVEMAGGNESAKSLKPLGKKMKKKLKIAKKKNHGKGKIRRKNV